VFLSVKLVNTQFSLGILFNMLLGILDCIFFFGLGGYCLYIGFVILKDGQEVREKIWFGGHLLVFSCSFQLASIVFNNLVEVQVSTIGRPISYFVQALSHAGNPESLSAFIISFGSFVMYAFLAIWFQRFLRKHFD
jgi:hypothetical protein